MICPYCGKEAKWCDNKEIYGKSYGRSFMCYYCKDCDAYVGCHNNTKSPLGTMANKELRDWRMKTHKVFDSIWNGGKLKRKGRGYAYDRLSKIMGYDTHIGNSNIEECKNIIEICQKYPTLYIQ